MTDDSTQFLVLNGIHTAGKTTIGSHLADEGYDYYPEIAAQLIEQEGFAGSTSGTDQFQRTVYERECERDARLLDEGRNAVIETWHPGTIAHAMEVASRELVERMQNHLEETLSRTDVEVTAVFLSVPPERIPERSDRFDEADADVIDFYERVRDNTKAVYCEYDIPHVEVETDGDVETAKQRVRSLTEDVFR